MRMNEKARNNVEDLKMLYKALLTLESEDDCADFMEDLCTVQELISLAQRFRVAKLLSERKIYNDIVQETGASTATISRVNRTLNYGKGGYKAVLRKIRDSAPNTDENEK